MIRVVGPRDVPPRELDEITTPTFVNTTSRQPGTWQRQLSPFYLGPVPLYEGAGLHEAKFMENAWQFAKVYRGYEHNGEPARGYWPWAREGWDSRRAQRYPMGKGAVPLFSWWDGEALDYIQARKKVYVPLYAKAIINTRAFLELQRLYQTYGELELWDFDAYDHHALGMSLKDVINDPTRKMGHAFVLAMLLERTVKDPGKSRTPAPKT